MINNKNYIQNEILLDTSHTSPTSPIRVSIEYYSIIWIYTYMTVTQWKATSSTDYKSISDDQTLVRQVICQTVLLSCQSLVSHQWWRAYENWLESCRIQSEQKKNCVVITKSWGQIVL